MAEIIALEAPLGQRTGAQSTDAELVGAVRQGDDRAFEELFARYHRRISAYVFGMVKDHARAEDVTQDVFMSALRRMRDTDRPIAFKPWIYEIAKNACIDQFRRSRRSEEVSMDADEGAGLASADHAKLVSAEPQPHARLEAKQDLDHLQGAFGGLSESHHQILVMREFEGLSYREIGERMGMSRPSVESTLFRARKRLAEEYDELVSGERCRRVHLIVEAASHSTLGARDQRRLARHVSHCQPCRRHVALAGLGDLVPARTGVRAKIAALLPLPGVLRERWLGIGGGATHPAGAGGGAIGNWAASLAPSMDAGWSKAVATAATVAVAGVGAGAVTSTNPSAANGAPGAASLMARHSIASSSRASLPVAKGSAPIPAAVKVVGGAVTAAATPAAQAAIQTPAPATPAAVTPTPPPATAPADPGPAASPTTPAPAPAATTPPAPTSASAPVPAVPSPSATAPVTAPAAPDLIAAIQQAAEATGVFTGTAAPLPAQKHTDVGTAVQTTVTTVQQTVQQTVEQTVQDTTDAVSGTVEDVGDVIKGALSSTLKGG